MTDDIGERMFRDRLAQGSPRMATRSSVLPGLFNIYTDARMPTDRALIVGEHPRLPDVAWSEWMDENLLRARDLTVVSLPLTDAPDEPIL